MTALAVPGASVPAIRLAVVGDPYTQGSKTAVRRGDKVWVAEAKGEGRIRHRAWRRAVAQEALAYRWQHRQLPLPLDEPVHVTIDFTLPRPISTKTTPGGLLKYTIPSWRRWPWTGFDADKLTRAALDSLVEAEDGSRLLLVTDARVVSLNVTKRFAEPGQADNAGAHILILPLGVDAERAAAPGSCPRCAVGLGGHCAHAGGAA